MKRLYFILCLLIFITVILIFFIRVRHHSSMYADVSFFKEDHDADAGVLKITFLDIGQGDATFIVFPTGEQMLVDCSIDSRILEALGRVMPFYDNTIDYVLVTHPDKDHYGGCNDVFDRFSVSSIIYNGFVKQQSAEWQEFWRFVTNESAVYTEVTSSQLFHIGSSTIHMLYPDHSLREEAAVPGYTTTNAADPNNGSIVFLLSYGNATFLFTGDAETEEEQYLVDAYGQVLDVDVLKVGHHGSQTSSIQPFLDVVTPAYAVVSVGVDNTYGHPSLRVLKRLERASSTLFRTDKQGDIVVHTDGMSYTWSTQRE